MLKSNPRYWLRSPLFRHPSLLLRKIGDRLGHGREFRFSEPPAGLRAVPQERLAVGLRSWIARCGLSEQPYASSRVFHQDFDRRELLAMCRSGSASSKDLRGDVKLIWEFSRGHSFVLNAGRAKPETRERTAREIAGEMEEWLTFNDDPGGWNWQCSMEVAIRAVNWICTDALLGGLVARALGEDKWSYWLWNHGRAIWARLEARLISSNHYIADLLGLFFVGSIFPADRCAKRWKEFALEEMQKAVLAQTYDDGGVYEASLPYHCLVTEMVLLFCLQADAKGSQAFQARVASMCRILADAKDVDGDVFQIGDNDGGRVIPLDFVSQGLGRADVVLSLAEQVLGRLFQRAASVALYPESGWWVGHGPNFTTVLEFGGVGMGGLGGHAHNDAQSMVVNWRQKRVLIDPGSCLYSSDPETRNQFRSTAFHNTLVVDDREQNDIPTRTPEDIFSLPGSSRAGIVLSNGPDGVVVTCRARSPGIIEHTRDVRMLTDSIRVIDRVQGAGKHKLTLAFHVHPDVRVEVSDNGLRLRVAGPADLRLSFHPGALRVGSHAARYSSFYGQSQPSSVFTVETTAELPWSFTWTLEEVSC